MLIYSFILLFIILACADYSGSNFRLLVVNTTDSYDTTQRLKITNASPSSSTDIISEIILGMDATQHAIQLNPDACFTMNVTVGSIYTIASSLKLFVIVETYRKANLVDASYIIPNDNLGTEYYVIGFCRYGSSCRITVMAVNNDTAINVNFKVTPNEPVYSNNGSEIVDKNMDFFINNVDILRFESHGDLSGTIIKGNDTFAVFFSTTVFDIQNFKDGVTRPVLPSVTLGTRYIVPRFHSTHGGLLKIVAAFGDTKVEVSSMDPIILVEPGDRIMKLISPNQGVVIDSNKPVLLSSVELEVTLGVVSPKFNSMIIIAPYEQWHNSMRFVVPFLNFGVSASITMVTHAKDKPLIPIGGTTIAAFQFYNIGGTAHHEFNFDITGKLMYETNTVAFDGDIFENDILDIAGTPFKFLAYFGNDFRFPLNHRLDVINQVTITCTNYLLCNYQLLMRLILYN